MTADQETVPVEVPERPTAWRRRALLNALYSGVGQAASKVSTFAWTAVAAHKLAQGDFGAFNFALSLGLLLVTVAEWGLDTALMQRVSRKPDDAARLFSQACAGQAVLSTVLFVAVGAVVLPSQSPSTRAAFVLVLAGVFLDTFSDSIRTVAAALQRQGGMSVALTVGRLTTAAIAIPIVLVRSGTLGLAAGFFAGCVVGLGAHLVVLSRLGVRPRLAHAAPSAVIRFFRGTAAFGIAALVLAGLFRFDAILLEWLRGNRALAAYSTAYKLFETVLFVAFAVSGSMFAVMSARGEKAEDTVPALRTGIVTVSTIYVPFAVACLFDAEFILSELFGSKYGVESAGSLRWLAVAPIAFGLSFLLSSSVTAIGHGRALVYAAVVATIVNIGGDLYAIPRWAGTGAACLTTVSYLVNAALLYGLYRRHVGRSIGTFRPLMPVAAGAVAMAATMLAVPHHALARLAAGTAAYTVVWLALTYRLDPPQLRAAVRLRP